MEDFLSMIALMIIYIAVAAANGKKKKKAKKTRAKGFQTAFDGGAPAREGRRSTQSKRPLEGRQMAFEKDCESRPIHLHEVSDSVMRHAGEGEDPCHAGGVDTRRPVSQGKEPPMDIVPDAEAECSEFAQDMLRGVIMSEILRRPCDRRGAKWDRRRV